MPSLWTEASGYMESKNLSRELRMAVRPGLRFRQFADIKDPDQQQRHKGAIFHWNVYSKLTADNGLTSRTLDETKVMPTGNFTITQGTLTITERGRLFFAALLFKLCDNFSSVVVRLSVA